MTQSGHSRPPNCAHGDSSASQGISSLEALKWRRSIGDLIGAVACGVGPLAGEAGTWRISIVFRVFLTGLVALIFLGNDVAAERANYGSVDLTGLARVSWPDNPPGPSNTMVCNVNGPDGYLSIRSGPGTQHSVNRNLKRLAIIEVDTRHRRGRWAKVLTAYRTHTIDGVRQGDKSLHVTGWAHDGYLCDFLD